MGIQTRDGLIIVFIVIAVLLSYGAGVYSGAQATLKIGIRLARGFVTFDIDEDLIQNAIFQYENNIGTCYPPLP